MQLLLSNSGEKLTAAAGLGTIIEIFDQSGLRDEFINQEGADIEISSVGTGMEHKISHWQMPLVRSVCLDDDDGDNGKHTTRHKVHGRKAIP
jgi:hypothetical protein